VGPLRLRSAPPQAQTSTYTTGYNITHIKIWKELSVTSLIVIEDVCVIYPGPREIFLGGKKTFGASRDLQNYFEINRN